MQYSQFFQEVLSGAPLIITLDGMRKYEPYLLQHHEGKILEFPDLEPLKMSIFSEDFNGIQNLNREEEPPENAVGIINLQGLLTRSGSWWDYGTEDLAEMFNHMVNDDRISAIVLRANCFGGTTECVVPLEAAMLKNIATVNKPVITAVDMFNYSASVYITAFSHKIFATHRMAEIGSIGVKRQMTFDDEWYKKMGIKKVTIKPPQSKWKDLTYDEAKKGKYDLMINEELKPWAEHFQSIVRANRPNIDESVEGILEGRGFFAFDAVKNGLMDGIMPFDEIVQYAANFKERQLLENY